jgi:membrane dipeptidase
MQELALTYGPAPSVSWERIIDHIDHAVKVAGIDHVGLGSDFDGGSLPDGMRQASELPKITEALMRKGYSDSDIKKILGLNTLRLLEDVQRVAATLAKQKL